MKEIKISLIRSDEVFSFRKAGYDSEVVEIIAGIKKKSVWGWCQVEVKATLKLSAEVTLTASEYLGGCSYHSRQDFIETSLYYDDMVNTVKADIMRQVEAIRKAIGAAEVIEESDEYVRVREMCEMQGITLSTERMQEIADSLEQSGGASSKELDRMIHASLR